MAKRILSDSQQRFFALLPHQGTLIFAAGPRGISANIVGDFSVKSLEHEDLLCMGDGTNHIHIDWSRIQSVEIGLFHGEGMLTVRDGDEVLFRLYRPSGPFSKALESLAGKLL